MGWLTRFLAAVAFLAVGIIFSPETFGSLSKGENSAKLLIFVKLGHLLSFATAWGAALWATFIGGIIMFKNLPRHQFGNLQSKMFPTYFTLVGSCCAISLAAFGYLHPWKSSSTVEKYQLGFLVSALAFNLTNLFIFTPMTIDMMKQRHKVERENNIGDEVGWSKNREKDIYCLDADGVLFDAALLSAAAAFLNLQIPIVALNDNGRIVAITGEKDQENASITEKEAVNKEKRKLTLKNIPFSLTCILHKNNC